MGAGRSYILLEEEPKKKAEGGQQPSEQGSHYSCSFCFAHSRIATDSWVLDSSQTAYIPVTRVQISAYNVSKIRRST